MAAAASFSNCALVRPLDPGGDFGRLLAKSAVRRTTSLARSSRANGFSSAARAAKRRTGPQRQRDAKHFRHVSPPGVAQRAALLYREIRRTVRRISVLYATLS